MKESCDFVEMNVPAKPEYVGVVRLSVSGIANRVGFSYDEIEDIKVAVSEACTNAVNHAYQQDDEGKMKVGFSIYDDRLEIMVIDRGKSFDFDTVRRDLGPFGKNVAVEKMSEGGLGLFLIEALMDKVEISGDSGVIVLMTKYLQKGEVGSSADTISATQRP
ncbi:MAG TPA: anti-sigma B factor RsbW [Bacillales bacterium]|nr:anti-sigma B factor RsbW [Bacillales bacterium]